MKWSRLWPQSEQVLIVLFKAGAILIRYGRRWSMSWARSTRKRGEGRQDQLVILKVVLTLWTYVYYISQGFFRSTWLLLLSSILLFTLASNELNRLHVLHEHEYYGWIPLTRFWLSTLTRVKLSVKFSEVLFFTLTCNLSHIASILFANVNFTHVRT